MTGLPPVDQALLPADVRNGTAKDKQAYAAAVGFERMLVEQLTKPLAQSALGGGDTGNDDSPQDSGSSVYSDMIAGSLADSVAQQGGLGLAGSLYRSFGTERS